MHKKEALYLASFFYYNFPRYWDITHLCALQNVQKGKNVFLKRHAGKPRIYRCRVFKKYQNKIPQSASVVLFSPQTSSL